MSEITIPSLDEKKSRLHIEVTEEVISTNVSQLRSEWISIMEAFPNEKWKSLYLDLRSCRMVDSMGLNWIFAESLRLKQNKKQFVVRISSPAINRVMEFAGLDKIITLKYRRRKQTR